MPEPSRGKRRRATQMSRRADRVGAPAKPSPGTAPVRGATVSSRLPGGWYLAAGVVVVVAVIAVIVLLRTGPSTGGVGASASSSPSASAGSPGSSAGASAAAGGSAAAGTCPTSQPDALPAGQTRTVTLNTPKGSMAIEVKADLSPIAAGNFVALASCGFYDGTPFHRTPTLQDGTPFVIQGGDPTGTGSGGPGYTIKDEPVTQPYKRGTVAMARSSAPEQRRLAVLHRPRRQGWGRPQVGEHLPDHRQRHPGDGDGRRHLRRVRGSRAPAEPDQDHDRDGRQPVSPGIERGARP